MSPKTVSIGEFRQHATEVVREVEETKVPVIITRHGTPVAEVRPISPAPTSLRGSVVFAPDYDPAEPAAPPEDWEAA